MFLSMSVVTFVYNYYRLVNNITLISRHINICKAPFYLINQLVVQMTERDGDILAIIFKLQICNLLINAKF